MKVDNVKDQQAMLMSTREDPQIFQGENWNKTKYNFRLNKTRMNRMEIQHIKNERDYTQNEQIRRQINKHKIQERLSIGNNSQLSKNRHKIKFQKQNAQEQQYQYTYPWSLQDDEKLKQFILFKQQYNWQNLSQYFNISVQQIIQRWGRKIYPKITIEWYAGCLKWLPSEDSILLGTTKYYSQNWDKVLPFFRGRSINSVKGRWRRLKKEQNRREKQQEESKISVEISEQQQSLRKDMNLYAYRKQVIKRMAKKQKIEYCFDLK